MTRRSFVEKVALAAGITAAGGGALFETLTPRTAEASNVPPPPLNGEAMMKRRRIRLESADDDLRRAARSGSNRVRVRGEHADAYVGWLPAIPGFYVSLYLNS